MSVWGYCFFIFLFGLNYYAAKMAYIILNKISLQIELEEKQRMIDKNEIENIVFVAWEKSLKNAGAIIDGQKILIDKLTTELQAVNDLLNEMANRTETIFCTKKNVN